MKLRPAVILPLAILFAAPLAAAGSAADIEKFNSVSDRVSTGGQPTPPQIADLKREGFRTILSLRQPSEYDAAAEEAAAKANGLAYVNIPVNPEAPKKEQVDQFLAVMASARPSVFIHCATGNRVAAFWMIRRVLVDQWDVEDAEREAKLVGLKSESLKAFARDYIRSHAAAR